MACYSSVSAACKAGADCIPAGGSALDGSYKGNERQMKWSEWTDCSTIKWNIDPKGYGGGQRIFKEEEEGGRRVNHGSCYWSNGI